MLSKGRPYPWNTRKGESRLEAEIEALLHGSWKVMKSVLFLRHKRLLIRCKWRPQEIEKADHS
jgi:hypothetical protein